MSSRVDISYLENDAPQVIMRRGFHSKGRPRIVPKEITELSELREALGKRVKDYTDLERKTYNRLASRNTYVKEKVKETENNTAQDYKKNMNKKIKDFSKEEKREYNRLAKKENRIKKNLAKGI